LYDLDVEHDGDHERIVRRAAASKLHQHSCVVHINAFHSKSPFSHRSLSAVSSGRVSRRHRRHRHHRVPGVPWRLQGTNDSGSSHRNTGIAPTTCIFIGSKILGINYFN
jgi:hypothetical protein